MEEVSDQGGVIAVAEIDGKGAAGKQMDAVAYTLRLGVLPGDFEDVGPIDGVDLRARDLPGYRYAEGPMARRDVQNLRRGFPLQGGLQHLSHGLRRRSHHRGHAAGKIHPDWVLSGKGLLVA